jgi:hypothetical protein
MMKIYTKIDGKLAAWEMDTQDVFIAWVSVKKQLPLEHKTALMVSIPCGTEQPTPEMEPEVA